MARNTYADFSDKKSRNSDRTYHGDPEELFSVLASPDGGDDSRELLDAVYRQIAFLTRAYREVMILFYLDGLPVAEIAGRQNTSEGAIRERLSSARKRIRSEVEKMAESSQRPVVLNQIDYWIMGNGNPLWGDPRKLCTRQLPRHLVWLCRKKSVSAAEAAEELHVPTVYVEEELEILRRGKTASTVCCAGWTVATRLPQGKAPAAPVPRADTRLISSCSTRRRWNSSARPTGADTGFLPGGSGLCGDP